MTEEENLNPSSRNNKIQLSREELLENECKMWEEKYIKIREIEAAKSQEFGHMQDRMFYFIIMALILGMAFGILIGKII